MLLEYFTDPVLRAPTIGSMLMCLASSLIGVIVFIRKKSLLGEALSHAAYPGVVLSTVVTASLFPGSDNIIAIAVLIGAFIFSLLGLWTIDLMERHLKVKNDAALCFVLSAFFGVGILIASRIQSTHALWYKQIQIFLYGQAATMTDIHILIYGLLCVFTLAVLFLFYRQIEVINFDRAFGKSVGIRVQQIDILLFLLLSLAIVIGIRCVGVVLMSGMLIAPPVAARQFSNRLWLVFGLSGFFGLLSGFFGNYLSMEIPIWSGHSEGIGKFSLPTGPMIILSASSMCILALLFAPRTGLTTRFCRLARFRYQCILENLLKCLWKKGPALSFSIQEISCIQQNSRLLLKFFLRRLMSQGWMEQTETGYRLTSAGQRRAARIVRLHRLWEVYLVDYLGHKVEKVHRNAEEMEHVITPELEKELTELLQDPKQDPHQQPIPEREVLT
ncbi:MAG TPA: iron chelate uptake ABC transporter family permease subunit [Rhabdochlamydiaceae bacterium]|nr:iron chelate uptake ABC transporter family permease subunit [Rhabdochlamydiaceae bacterium]